MTDHERNLRALFVLGPAMVVILLMRFYTGGGSAAPTAAAPTDSIPRAEKRLERLRRLAAGLPAREAALKQAAAEAVTREKGLLVAETASQAQAQLLQIIRKVGKDNGIDVRGGEIGQIRELGPDYGEVTVAVSFECPIEKLVNFLTTLTATPEALATNEIRLASANVKEKTVTARIGVSGVVPRRLVPAKKGPSSF